MSTEANNKTSARDGRPTRVRIFDLISRVLPSAFFLIIVIANAINLYHLLNGRPGVGDAPEGWNLAAAVLAKASTTCFLALMSILFLIRIEPIKKSSGIWPRVTAIAGTFCLYFVTLFPRANLSLNQTLLSAFISIIGTALSIFTLAHLGRSFSLMAEARRLVTSGPYRFVRHPLYLFETMASFGILLQFLSFYTVLVFLAYMLLQLQRMNNEEAILERVFPEYREYRSRTAKLIPGVY
ncbi:MAG: isoprenylcysteine carboxylmethyltransferase family protein [bacterium]